MLNYVETRDYSKYTKLIKDLTPDFGVEFQNTVKHWCNPSRQTDSEYWQVWIIKNNKSVIGICGLYSLNSDVKDLWLGWFGILPDKRSAGIGTQVLQEFLIPIAILTGAHNLYSYVDKHGKPLPFYFRNGFKRIGTVKSFAAQKKWSKQFIHNEFEDVNDHIIKLKLI